VGDFLILRACRESNGYAVTVTDDEIDAAQKEFGAAEGILLCPEGAATYAAYKNGLTSGAIAKGETALLFNCATGLKYPMPPSNKNIDITKPVDYDAIKKGM
jgi:threonine synthase